MNSCSGHILLAYADNEERERMLERIPAHHKKTNKKQIKEMIKRVRDQGYERIASAQAQGVQDIGYPVFDYSGQVIAALVVPFLTHLDDSNPIGLEQAQEHVYRAACEASDALGYRME